MGSFHIFHFLSLLLLLSTAEIGFCGSDSCKPSKCRKDGPVIRFPFRIKDRQPPYCGYPGFDVSCQPPYCGYPGFDVSCQDGNTLIHIPSVNGDVVVADIDYREERMEIIADPNSKDCIWRLLYKGLNLSASPFVFDSSDTDNFTFIRCSKTQDSSDYDISCLGDSEHEVFVFEATSTVDTMQLSCEPMKTIAMPLSYQYNVGIRDYIYFIHLRWDVPVCKECKSKGRECGFKNQSSSDIICFDNHGSNMKYEIIGASIGFFLLLITIAAGVKVCFSWKLNRKLDLENEIKVEKFLEGYKSLKPTRYSYADLKRMTDQFKEKIGQGGYGSVFKGKLPNGTVVAIKILQTFAGDGAEFINEVGSIGRIHHVNVVRLLGFCVDRLKRALIYEFMPNESLEKFIFSKSTDNFLGWEKLQGIAIGVARGIEYLHQGCEQRILHFDIKPHNILLDQNFNPKISDFGLAKLCSKGQSVVSMRAARGTMGYIAPEVYSRNFGNVSYKSDVYSFGMLLLEMVGGRKNIDITVDKTSQVYFPEWIYKRLCQGEDMGLTFAAIEDSTIARRLTIVALWCIQWYPADRPSMTTVVQMLEGNVETLTMPTNPFATTTSVNTNLEDPQVAKLSTIPE